jgi:hypothetical protein
MKIILAILCLLMVLFGGGCALMTGGFGGQLNAVPVAVAIFNGFVLAALFGWANPWKPAFYVLAVADILIAIAVMVAAIGFSGADPTLMPWAMLLAGAFALKGALTWFYVRSLPSRNQE